MSKVETLADAARRLGRCPPSPRLRDAERRATRLEALGRFAAPGPDALEQLREVDARPDRDPTRVVTLRPQESEDDS